MKTVNAVMIAIRNRLESRWNLQVAGQDPQAWPHTVALGSPSKDELESDFPTARQWALDWNDWASAHGLTLVKQPRRVMGTSQLMPTHLEIPDIDAAARLAGKEWSQLLRTARHRSATLTHLFGHIDVAATLAAARQLSDVDFELLLTAAAWFAANNASGLTPRQVPIEGLHGKWLNRYRALVQNLAGKHDLGLISRPTRVHITYLDPAHIAAGHRKHDSFTLGDHAAPAYAPEIVVILENKDTAAYFPSLHRGIAVEGEGSKAPGVLPHLPWITAAPLVVYWGDMDAAGLSIVNNLRLKGLPVRTILMDRITYDTYERFGAWTDEKGDKLGCPPRRAADALTPDELALYTDLTDPAWARVRRIEQERIPLSDAVRALEPLRVATTYGQASVELDKRPRHCHLE